MNSPLHYCLQFDTDVAVFSYMIWMNNLEGNIQDVQFSLGEGVQTQKRQQLSIRVWPNIIVNIPFAGVKEFTAGYMKANSNSQKYFKNYLKYT